MKNFNPIDLRTIEINPIPQPVIELQNTNSNLQRNNKLLTQLLIVGGVAIAVILVAAVIDNYLKDKNFATVRQKPKKNQEEV